MPNKSSRKGASQKEEERSITLRERKDEESESRLRSSSNSQRTQISSSARSLGKGGSNHSRHSRRSTLASLPDDERRRRVMEDSDAKRRAPTRTKSDIVRRSHSSRRSSLYVDGRRRRSTLFNDNEETGNFLEERDKDEETKWRSTPGRRKSSSSRLSRSSRGSNLDKLDFDGTELELPSRTRSTDGLQRKSSSVRRSRSYSGIGSVNMPGLRLVDNDEDTASSQIVKRRSRDKSMGNLDTMSEHSRRSRRSTRRSVVSSPNDARQPSRRSTEDTIITNHQTSDHNNTAPSRRRSRSSARSKRIISEQVGAFSGIELEDSGPARRSGVPVMEATAVDERREQQRLASLQADNQGLRRQMDEDAHENQKEKEDQERKSKKRGICFCILVLLVLIAVGIVAFMVGGNDTVTIVDNNSTVVIIREVAVYMDVTIVDGGVNLYEVLEAFEGAFDGHIVPSLACDSESDRMLEEGANNNLSETGSNESISRLDQANLEVCDFISSIDTSAKFFGSCDCAAVQPCYRIIMDLEVSLTEDENVEAVLEHIEDSISTADASSGIPSLLETMKLPTIFKTVETIDVVNQSPTGAPSRTLSEVPTSSPTPLQMGTPATSKSTTKDPTDSPSVKPTRMPVTYPTTEYPTKSPTSSPTFVPSGMPTSQPTLKPTTSPTSQPTSSPTKGPTDSPSVKPTRMPVTYPTTEYPTKTPTTSPTLVPSGMPTSQPTSKPTTSPTAVPSDSPTYLPTKSPTESPTTFPSAFPTPLSSAKPSVEPSRLPTKTPSMRPTQQPTVTPSSSPTEPMTAPPTSSPSLSVSFSPTSSSNYPLPECPIIPSFQITNLGVPYLTSPCDGAIFSHYPRSTLVEWQMVGKASSYVVQKDFAWNSNGCDGKFTAGCFGSYPDYYTSNLYHNFTFGGGQPGRWRVSAVFPNSTSLNPSQWFHFRYTQRR